MMSQSKSENIFSKSLIVPYARIEEELTKPFHEDMA